MKKKYLVLVLIVLVVLFALVILVWNANIVFTNIERIKTYPPDAYKSTKTMLIIYSFLAIFSLFICISSIIIFIYIYKIDFSKTRAEREQIAIEKAEQKKQERIKQLENELNELKKE